MNRREEICAGLLRVLNEEETPLNEVVLESMVGNRMSGSRLLTSEFDEALRMCERARWVSGIRSGIKGLRWVITDTGRGELAR